MPLLLLTNLLQTTAAQSADVRFMEWAIRLAPIAITIYIYLQAPSRETVKKREKDLADLLTWKELQQAINTQHQLGMEKLGDEMERSHRDHEVKLGQLGDMKTDVAVMKSQMENQTRAFQEMNHKLDRLLSQERK